MSRAGVEVSRDHHDRRRQGIQLIAGLADIGFREVCEEGPVTGLSEGGGAAASKTLIWDNATTFGLVNPYNGTEHTTAHLVEGDSTDGRLVCQGGDRGGPPIQRTTGSSVTAVATIVVTAPQEGPVGPGVLQSRSNTSRPRLLNEDQRLRQENNPWEETFSGDGRLGAERLVYQPLGPVSVQAACSVATANSNNPDDERFSRRAPPPPPASAHPSRATHHGPLHRR
jgi:hypothetical protein